jgi:hypothetical protein
MVWVNRITASDKPIRQNVEASATPIALCISATCTCLHKLEQTAALTSITAPCVNAKAAVGAIEQLPGAGPISIQPDAVSDAESIARTTAAGLQ